MMATPHETGELPAAREGDALRLFGVAAIEPGETALLAPDTSLVSFREIAAIVARSPYSRALVGEQEIEEYSRVIGAVYERVPILPAPPGTIVRSEAIVARWLELHYVTLSEALQTVEGNVVARVRVLLKNGASPDDRQMHALATETLRTLRGQASATVTIRGPDADPRLAGHVSFLVDRDRWSVFADAVTAERTRHPQLELELSGPWPPYDFVRMQFGA